PEGRAASCQTPAARRGCAPDYASIESPPVPRSGDVPSPINPPPGCAFHTRCPYAFDRCKVDTPKLVELSPGHGVSCHLRVN
ncbi:MAG: hypothetical protein E6G69_15965, partial [Alphaproteobacteria bacterium]